MLGSTKFSQFVISLDDLYYLEIKKGFSPPLDKSLSVYELTLFIFLKGYYMCPSYDGNKLKSYLKLPKKEVIKSLLIHLFASTTRHLSELALLRVGHGGS